MAVRFPYLPLVSARGDSSLMPILPLTLRPKDGVPLQVHGLLDSGAAVNVLPYTVGLRLGASWEAQAIRVTLTGNLAAQEARALLTYGTVADFPPVQLAFAWTRADNTQIGGAN